MKVLDLYEKSLQELKTYIDLIKDIPSEQQWNKYCVKQNLLSSKSLEYIYGKGFNKMCRNLMKKSRKEEV